MNKRYHCPKCEHINVSKPDEYNSMECKYCHSRFNLNDSKKYSMASVLEIFKNLPKVGKTK